ncbi:cupin domain-containing protein [Patulibacter americanus]|uniref:cupin domain-containing protein n=1 Tax=Patulibacter americanus TaxID=588672 RepID=UPI0003B3DD4B|nr:cupin domain-containing protein [Patulibacter americanus]
MVTPSSPLLPAVTALDDLATSSGVARFQGAVDGGAARPAASFFVVRTAPGGGSALHIHPYPEVFVLLEGTAELRVGEVSVALAAGGVLTAPAGVPHRYRNTGDAPLLMFSIHPAEAVAQTLVPPT